MRFDEEPNYSKLLSLFDSLIEPCTPLRPISIDGALKVILAVFSDRSKERKDAYKSGECSKEGEEYPLFESWSLILFEIWRKLLRWSFRTALLGMELIRHSYSQSAE
ncbi:hypothetical protein P8452_61749 [Trifolium repens]|nr:hypothetical protein P8452_61749 [Trifolium repens]